MVSHETFQASNATEGHKVHFTEDCDTFSDHSAISVQQVDDGKYTVHLGFLKLQHRYEVRFPVDVPLENVIQNPPHLYVKLLEVISDRECNEIRVEFFAYKEKLLKEFLVLDDVKTHQTFTFVMNARILGKDKGTPSLKTGIRCIGCELEDESEASDWHGFD